MAKDPAMLWYWGDWHSGTTTLSRFLKGCYMDLLHAQFNSGHLSLEEIKTVLGSDFGQSWPTIQKKFAVDPAGKYFNVRLEVEQVKRANYTASRRKNLEQTSISPHMKKHKVRHMHSHMENENEIVNANEKGLLKEYDEWTEQILDRNDRYFEDKLMKEQIPESPAIEFWVKDHLDLLNRYPKMRPPNQESFRKSCLKHVRENYKKPITSNGTAANKKHQQSVNTATYLSDYYAEKLSKSKAKPDATAP